MKKEQKWNIFLVKIEDKDDQQLTQHVITDLNWQLVWNIASISICKMKYRIVFDISK